MAKSNFVKIKVADDYGQIIKGVYPRKKAKSIFAQLEAKFR